MHFLPRPAFVLSGGGLMITESMAGWHRGSVLPPDSFFTTFSKGKLLSDTSRKGFCLHLCCKAFCSFTGIASVTPHCTGHWLSDDVWVTVPMDSSSNCWVKQPESPLWWLLTFGELQNWLRLTCLWLKTMGGATRLGCAGWSLFFGKGSSLKGSGMVAGKKLTWGGQGFSGEGFNSGIIWGTKEAAKCCPLTQFWLLSMSVERSNNRTSLVSC